MAETYGWDFEKIPGSPALFEKMLTATNTTVEILAVAPRHIVAFDAVAGTLPAIVRWGLHPRLRDSSTLFGSGCIEK